MENKNDKTGVIGDSSLKNLAQDRNEWRVFWMVTCQY